MIFQLTGREKNRGTLAIRVRLGSSDSVRARSGPQPDPPSPEVHPAPPPNRPEPDSIAEPFHPPEKSKDDTLTGDRKIKPFDDCDRYEAQGGCRTMIHQRYDGNRGDILRCVTCGRTFSARRGKLNFRSRLSPERLEQLVTCHRRGDSIRNTAKKLGLNRGTVRRYFRLMDNERSGMDR